MNQNFGLPYQPYPNMIPNMMNVPPTIINSECNVDMNDFDKRLEQLERKVQNIENYINKNTINNYNSPNYQML